MDVVVIRWGLVWGLVPDSQIQTPHAFYRRRGKCGKNGQLNFCTSTAAELRQGGIVLEVRFRFGSILPNFWDLNDSGAVRTELREHYGGLAVTSDRL